MKLSIIFGVTQVSLFALSVFFPNLIFFVYLQSIDDLWDHFEFIQRVVFQETLQRLLGIHTPDGVHAFHIWLHVLSHHRQVVHRLSRMRPFPPPLLLSP